MDDTKIFSNNYGYCLYSYCTEFTKHDDTMHRFYGIYNLFVHPQYRGQGYAREILQAVIAIIRQTGYTREMKIESDPTDPLISVKRLATFYESLGLTLY